MKFQRTAFLIALGFAILIASADRLAAQNTTSGALTGVVTDSSDAVVPGARVELKDKAKGTTHVGTTDGEGRYLFSFLRPGRYSLTVTKKGFAPATHNLDVFLGPPATLNLTLSVASGASSIIVTAERPLIDAENGDAATSMTERQVSALPNPGNDLTYLAQTAPGVVMNTDQGVGNFSDLGLPAVSNLFTLNGMSYNSVGPSLNMSGALNMLLGQNEVQEATVVSNGYSGQFGNVAGANVNYISKSGGNAFHGNAAYGWNGRILNANDWFNNANGVKRPFDNVNQWAGSLGGPIQRDKLFFFFNTEGIHLLLPPPPFPIQLPSPQLQAATLANIDARFGSNSASDRFYRQIFNLYNAAPGASGALPGGFGNDSLGCGGFVGPNGLGTSVPCAVHFATTRDSPTDESLISGRVDWNLRSSDRVFLLVQYDHGHQASYTDPISPLFDVGSDQPWWQGQLSETHTFGADTANQFLVAGWYFSAIFKPRNLAQTLNAFPTDLSWGNSGLGFPNLGGIEPTGTNVTHYQLTDDLVKTRGNHKMSLGANLLGEDWTDHPYSYNAIGRLTPQTLDAFFQGGIDPGVLAGTDPNPDFTALNQSFASAASARLHFAAFGLYGQDEWHARPGLSLALALRGEHQANPTCQRRCFARLTAPFDSVSHDPNIPYNQVIATGQEDAFERLDKVLWMPRFSFAWQPLGVSHHTVVRGGIGLFYDLVPSGIASLFDTNPPLRRLFTAVAGNLAPGETTSLFKNTAASDAAFLQGFAAGETLAQIQQAIAAIDPAGFSPPALFLPGAQMHAAQYQKWSLELQQTLGAGTSVTLGYYGNHGTHELIQNGSANAFGFGTLPQGPCSSPPVPPCADPRFGQVSVWNTPGVSNYNGMVVSVLRRWSRGLVGLNYTWGHAFDEASNDGLGPFLGSFSDDVQPPDSRNLRANYGSAAYDVRHSVNASYVWDVPVRAALRGHGPQSLVNGWQVAGTLFARTGFPYTVIDFFKAGNLTGNNFSGPIYAVPVQPLGSTGPCGEGAALPTGPQPCLPPETLPDGTPNPNALFVQPGCETGFNTGNLPSASNPCGGPAVSFAQGRNRFRGPGYFNTDLAVMKNTKVPGWEGATVGVGVQFFNLLNHPNFGQPDNSPADSFIGQIPYMEMPPTSLLGSGLGGDVSPRMIELKVLLQF
jgi:carboxypeptidase family protein